MGRDKAVWRQHDPHCKLKGFGAHVVVILRGYRRKSPGEDLTLELLRKINRAEREFLLHTWHPIRCMIVVHMNPYRNLQTNAAVHNSS